MMAAIERGAAPRRASSNKTSSDIKSNHSAVTSKQPASTLEDAAHPNASQARTGSSSYRACTLGQMARRERQIKRCGAIAYNYTPGSLAIMLMATCLLLIGVYATPIEGKDFDWNDFGVTLTGAGASNKFGHLAASNASHSQAAANLRLLVEAANAQRRMSKSSLMPIVSTSSGVVGGASGQDTYAIDGSGHASLVANTNLTSGSSALVDPSSSASSSASSTASAYSALSASLANLKSRLNARGITLSAGPPSGSSLSATSSGIGAPGAAGNSLSMAASGPSATYVSAATGEPVLAANASHHHHYYTTSAGGVVSGAEQLHLAPQAATYLSVAGDPSSLSGVADQLSYSQLDASTAAAGGSAPGSANKTIVLAIPAKINFLTADGRGALGNGADAAAAAAAAQSHLMSSPGTIAIKASHARLSAAGLAPESLAAAMAASGHQMPHHHSHHQHAVLAASSPEEAVHQQPHYVILNQQAAPAAGPEHQAAIAVQPQQTVVDHQQATLYAPAQYAPATQTIKYVQAAAPQPAYTHQQVANIYETAAAAAAAAESMGERRAAACLDTCNPADARWRKYTLTKYKYCCARSMSYDAQSFESYPNPDKLASSSQDEAHYSYLYRKTRNNSSSRRNKRRSRSQRAKQQQQQQQEVAAALVANSDQSSLSAQQDSVDSQPGGVSYMSHVGSSADSSGSPYVKYYKMQSDGVVERAPEVMQVAQRKSRRSRSRDMAPASGVDSNAQLSLSSDGVDASTGGAAQQGSPDGGELGGAEYGVIQEPRSYTSAALMATRGQADLGLTSVAPTASYIGYGAARGSYLMAADVADDAHYAANGGGSYESDPMDAPEPGTGSGQLQQSGTGKYDTASPDYASDETAAANYEPSQPADELESMGPRSQQPDAYNSRQHLSIGSAQGGNKQRARKLAALLSTNVGSGAVSVGSSSKRYRHSGGFKSMSSSRNSRNGRSRRMNRNKVANEYQALSSQNSNNNQYNGSDYETAQPEPSYETAMQQDNQYENEQYNGDQHIGVSGLAGSSQNVTQEMGTPNSAVSSAGANSDSLDKETYRLLRNKYNRALNDSTVASLSKTTMHLKEILSILERKVNFKQQHQPQAQPQQHPVNIQNDTTSVTTPSPLVSSTPSSVSALPSTTPATTTTSVYSMTLLGRQYSSAALSDALSSSDYLLSDLSSLSKPHKQSYDASSLPQLSSLSSSALSLPSSGYSELASSLLTPSQYSQLAASLSSSKHLSPSSSLTSPYGLPPRKRRNKSAHLHPSHHHLMTSSGLARYPSIHHPIMVPKPPSSAVTLASLGHPHSQHIPHHHSHHHLPTHSSLYHSMSSSPSSSSTGLSSASNSLLQAAAALGKSALLNPYYSPLQYPYWYSRVLSPAVTSSYPYKNVKPSSYHHSHHPSPPASSSAAIFSHGLHSSPYSSTISLLANGHIPPKHVVAAPSYSDDSSRYNSYDPLANVASTLRSNSAFRYRTKPLMLQHSISPLYSRSALLSQHLADVTQK